MKKKIIIITSLICLIFLAGGVYIITSIKSATSELDHLIELYQVEIQREHLLIQVKGVQSDFFLMGTHFAKSRDTIVTNIEKMKRVSTACFHCHHEPSVKDRLEKLDNDIDLYIGSINKILNARGNRTLLIKESNIAFRISENVLAQINDMVHIANTKLAERTDASLKDIADSKKILYALVGITPFIAAAVCLFFIRALTKPIKILLDATRSLKRGNLDYKIKGLKNEFGELATSFNGMSDSLNQTMHKIQESENRYRTLFESAGDAIFILETEGENIGDILEANRAAAEMHGISIEKLLTLNLIKDLDAPDADEQAPGRLERILKGEKLKAELNHRKEDGTIFPVEVSASLLEYMGHKYILAIDRDVSERKEMENMILQSKLEWESTFNTITDMITIHDRDFNIIRANKAAEKMLGLPVLNLTQAKCYQYYHGKDLAPDDCPSCECFRTGKAATFEMYEPHLDKFLEIRAMPRFDSNHQMIGLIHVVRDITEGKGVEATLQRTEQLKMVGEMAAGLAHEIKNPLAGIKGSMQYLAEEESILEEDRGLIVKSVDQIKRIELLIKSLLNFAKPPQLQLMLTNINDLLEKTISFSLKNPALSSNSPAPIEVKKDFEQGIPETMADPMQLQQVFLNLMLNAIEAMPDGGILTVKTSYDAERSVIQVAIADTGKGMDKAVQEKIFQPFFTTKPKGSGLGLAITRRLIEQHGGDVCVESMLNKGTVFNISLQMQPEEKEQIV